MSFLNWDKDSIERNFRLLLPGIKIDDLVLGPVLAAAKQSEAIVSSLGGAIGLLNGCVSYTIGIHFGSNFMEKSSFYIVDAFWDAEAGVWVATSDEGLGLATEAATIEQLTQKLRFIIPELIQLNQLLPADYQGSI